VTLILPPPEPLLKSEVGEVLGDIVKVLLGDCEIGTVEEGEVGGVISLSELSEHVAGDGIHIGLVVGVMEFPIDLGRLLTGGRESGVLGDGIIPLEHSVGVQEVSNLTESRNIHGLTGNRSPTQPRCLVLANLARKMARAMRYLSDESVQMPALVKSEKGALLFGFTKTKKSGVSCLEGAETRLQGGFQSGRWFHLPYLG
jgi:hypothetical protein